MAISFLRSCISYGVERVVPIELGWATNVATRKLFGREVYNSDFSGGMTDLMAARAKQAVIWAAHFNATSPLGAFVYVGLIVHHIVDQHNKMIRKDLTAAVKKLQKANEAFKDIEISLKKTKESLETQIEYLKQETLSQADINKSLKEQIETLREQLEAFKNANETLDSLKSDIQLSEEKLTATREDLDENTKLLHSLSGYINKQMVAFADSTKANIKEFKTTSNQHLKELGDLITEFKEVINSRAS